jgi:hypothetical protein
MPSLPQARPSLSPVTSLVCPARPSPAPMAWRKLIAEHRSGCRGVAPTPDHRPLHASIGPRRPQVPTHPGAAPLGGRTANRWRLTEKACSLPERPPRAGVKRRSGSGTLTLPASPAQRTCGRWSGPRDGRWMMLCSRRCLSSSNISPCTPAMHPDLACYAGPATRRPPSAHAPADRPGIGEGVMPGTTRAHGDPGGAGAGAAGDAVDAGGLQGFGQGHGRQDGGAPVRHYRLARPGGGPAVACYGQNACMTFSFSSAS